MNNQKISIIIPTWKRHKYLRKIIYALNNSDYRKYIEIIIVDSTASFNIKRYSKDNIKYFNSPTNSNSVKRNIGLFKAKYRNIIFIDDDCVPERNFTFKQLSLLQKSRMKTFFCGSVEYPFSLVKKNKYLSLRNRSHFKIKSNSTKKSFEIPASKIVTMNMSFKIFFNKYFYIFDKKFANYGFEDYDYGFRMLKLGYKFYMSNALVSHLDDRTYDKFLKKFFFLGNIAASKFNLINPKAFKETNYHKLENFFIVNIFFNSIIFYKIVKFLNIILLKLNYTIHFKSQFIFKISTSLSYLLGYLSKVNYKKIEINWYH